MSEPTQMQSSRDAILAINDPARRLSQLWRQGVRPRVEDFLAQAGVSDPAVVVTVLRVDQWERQRLGQWIPAESYLDAFPSVRDDPERAVDVVFAEYLLREQLGESPSPSEYVRRFPQHAGQFKLQVELHRAMQEHACCQWPATWGEGQPLQSANRRTDSEAAAAHEFKEYPDIPGYEVLGVLGWGGMGVVYRAWQQSLNRTVALKMVHAGARADPQVLERFWIEAEAVARLQHPNIVQIHEVGQHGGYPFLVLELVEGPSLAQSLAGTPRPARRAAELVETLARAIHSAHCMGVVHRDLTPANVLLTDDDRPKITDFGLAKLIIGGGDLRTQTGELLGTPSYMAPEQAASRHQAIGATTDVYALGAILYELLTGRPPFKAESPLETLRQVVAEEPVAPSRLRPKLPRDLETISLKCLRKEPAQRYGSALALADDLRRFLDGRPILARRSSVVERAWRWCRRNRVVAGSLASVVALLVLLAVGSFLAALRLQQAEHTATEKLWGAYLAQSQAGRSSGRAGRHFGSLDAVARAAALDTFPERRHELRDEAIACMPLVDLRVARQWNGRPPGTAGLAIDPQFKRYARCADDGTVSVRRVADDAEIYQFAIAKFGEYWATFSPDGRFLAVAFAARAPDHNLRIWDLDRGAPVAACPPVATTLGFRPDARQLATSESDGVISLFDLPAVTLVRQWNAGGPLKCQALDPVRPHVALALHGSSEIRVCDSAQGRVLRTLPSPTQVDYLAWRGDGKLLAAACGTTIQIWDMTSNRLLSVLEGNQNRGIRFDFNRRGDLLATIGWDGHTRLWDPVSGRLHLSLYGDFMGWRADGEQLSYWLGSQVAIADVASGSECWSLPNALVGNRSPPTEIGPNSVEFSPDGRLLASGDIDGVRIYRGADGVELGLLPIGSCESAVFELDGSLLTYNYAVGLARWPFQNQRGAEVRVGPPELLDVPGNPVPHNRRVARDRQGRRLAVTDFGNGQAVLFEATNPRARTFLRPHANNAEVAFSPDGRWVATGTWKGANVRVWDAASGSLAADLPAADATVGFSPDGRWLVAGEGEAFHFYRAGSWQPGMILPRDTSSTVRGPFTFRPDGRVLAVGTMVQHESVVQLIDPESGKALATLRAPEDFWITSLAFSPDGGRLAVATVSHRIRVWDLRRIRGRLKAIGLDQGLPPESPTDPAGTVTLPVERATVVGVDPLALRRFRVRQVLGGFWDQVMGLLSTQLPDAMAYRERAYRFERLGRWELAVADLDQAIRSTPGDPRLFEARARDHLRLDQHAQAINDLRNALELDADRPGTSNLLAWIYLTAPRDLLDPPAALRLAQRAVQSRPEDRSFRNTLGVAYYRVGQFARAVETLESNAKTDHPDLASDLLFLAMSRHRMGQPDRARSEFDRAARWRLARVGLDQGIDAELRSFEAEARVVLSGPPGH
jgi:WD40 repeat protein